MKLGAADLTEIAGVFPLNGGAGAPPRGTDDAPAAGLSGPRAALGRGPGLNPQRAGAPAQLAPAIEERSASLVLSPVGGKAPADDCAQLADMHESVKVRRELGEQQHLVIQRDRVVARAVERGRHELRPHLPIPTIEGDIRLPRCRDNSKFRHGACEDAQAVAAHPLGAAYEAAREAVMAEAA